MQPALKTDLVYCLRILEAIGKIELYANGYEDPFVFFDLTIKKILMPAYYSYCTSVSR